MRILNLESLPKSLTVAMMISLTSCTLTPAPVLPELVQDVEAWSEFENEPSQAKEFSSVNGWWLNLGGAELDGLVQVLRSDSLVLREARLQASQARARVAVAAGQSAPSLSVNADVSATEAPDLSGDFSWNESYSAGVTTSFDTDIFGRLRSTERAAVLNARAIELNYLSTEQRETAILAKSWISASVLKKRLELAQRNAESFEATFVLTNQRYRAGGQNTSASDVQIAKQNLDFALVDLPDISQQLKSQLLSIDEQLVRSPGTTEKAFRGFYELTVQMPVPIGTPASLLSNRPDVAAAELRYLAALEDVGSTRASLYPAIQLSAALTFQSADIEDVFSWDRHITSLVSSLAQPVFQGGRLRAQVEIERLEAEELASAFARSTLGAVIDVESALAEIEGFVEQRQRLVAAVESATLANEIAQSRYRQGLASLLSVLETQRGLNNAELNLILNEQALMNAQVDLFSAIGGVWFPDDSNPLQPDGA